MIASARGQIARRRIAMQSRGGFLVPLRFQRDMEQALEWMALESLASTHERRLWRAVRRAMERRFR